MRAYVAFMLGMATIAVAPDETIAVEPDPPNDPFVLLEDGCFGEIQGYTDPRTGEVGMEFRYDCSLLGGAAPPPIWFRIEPDAAAELAWEWHAAGGVH